MLKVVIGIQLLVLLLSGAVSAEMPPFQKGSATRTVCPVGCDHTTIQAAITAATAGDTIQIATTTAHTEADIIITKEIVIEGIDRNETIVQAAATPNSNNGRVFTVIADVDATFRTLTIRHGDTALNASGGGIWIMAGNDPNALVTVEAVTIEENEATHGAGIANEAQLLMSDVLVDENDAAGGGGGINNSGMLMLDNVTVRGNTALSGGGIYNSADLTIHASQIRSNISFGNGGGTYNSGTLDVGMGTTFSFNNASVEGGGLHNAHSGTATITETIFHDNSVDESSTCGGGIYSRNMLTLRDSSVTSNFTGNGGRGGGLCSMVFGNLTMERVVISGNNASTGGGLFVENSTVDLRQVAINDNQATTGGGLAQQVGATVKMTNVTIGRNFALSHAGGLYLGDGTLQLANVTIAHNTADADTNGSGNGGGIYITSNRDSATLRSSIIGNNTAHGGDHDDCFGSFTAASNSLVSDLGPVGPDRCSWGQFSTGMVFGVAPALDPLSGIGFAQGYPLRSTSPAIDEGACLDVDGLPLAIDQRNALMPVDGGSGSAECDMGAFEYNGVPTVVGISEQAAGADVVNSEQWVFWLFVILMVVTLGMWAACPHWRPNSQCAFNGAT